MKSNLLYLIGVSHVDIDGKSRLEHILNKIKPKTIAVEMSIEREATFEPNLVLDETEEVISRMKKEAD